ncbi:MAG: imidazole glycerol-phosphate synthase subunit HisH [Alphaproteobacteria bacterium]|jgi:glutamine amidotransferase|nr:imidazole glycerol-phosphate synthase subunit HisH [Alphaproteobacteria bacterium]
MSARRVTIVDYGIGNLLSAARALSHCGADVELTGRPEAIAAADRLVLPGVGAFADCMRALAGHDVAVPVREFAASGKPLLGICVGMQMLFDSSEEFGEHPGLGLMPGCIKLIPDTTTSGAQQKVPHIGWTSVQPMAGEEGTWAGSILETSRPGSEFYFLHSYTAWPDQEAHRMADADYGGRRISAVVRNGNIYGTQFHPEKSGRNGLAVLARFLAG